jgi:hypothetical protein
LKVFSHKKNKIEEKKRRKTDGIIEYDGCGLVIKDSQLEQNILV